MNDAIGANSCEEYHSAISDDALQADSRARFAIQNIKARRASVLVIDGAGPACTLLRLARQQVAHRCLIIYVQQRLTCVLMDLDVHGAAALEVCSTIRALPEATEAIILLMSARPCVSTFDAALLAGADEILFKPLATDDLVEQVERALEPNRHSGAELRRRCERLCQQRSQLEALALATR